jgi:hypothetical protein
MADVAERDQIVEAGSQVPVVDEGDTVVDL